jgi:hypothetical protein
MLLSHTIVPPARPAVRRAAWGSLLADAPWDGLPRDPVPVRIPATIAGRMPAGTSAGLDAGYAVGVGPRPRKRLAFGTLLSSAPWAGRAEAPEPIVPAPVADFPATPFTPDALVGLT